ncbi:MAG: DUF2332 domain-containing protein [Nocardioides sp.]|uniref:DUF2332 domain-containing protein n=1 Tax=Nocardioides sp. TaxID=35761 RepID=UPI0039E32771
MEPYADVAESYLSFAAYAAPDSPTFAEWATHLADDPEVSAWVASLPGPKQQPNLVFAAARWHGVPAPGPYSNLREALLRDDGAIRATILRRATQTNEVGRLATLVPAFAQVPGPLALVEVGASAGLCLFPDRWGYRWESESDITSLGGDPVLPCRVSGPVPLPPRLPEIAWRGGIDISPLDVRDADQMAWLAQLVWPEQQRRLVTLAHAIEIASAAPPHLVRGDLLEELTGQVEIARGFGTVVVFHSAVIAYLEPTDRLRFDAMMRQLVAQGECHWVSNEGKNVLPSITATGPAIPADRQTFVLGIDGQMVAETHGHGRAMRWTAEPFSR